MTERIQQPPTGTCLVRSPEVQAEYEVYMAEQRSRYGDRVPCPFDEGRLEDEAILSEEATAVTLEARFPYAVYDSQKVEEHLLLVPKRHVRVLGQLSLRERDDYWALLSKHEDMGFSSMTRSSTNNARSVLGHVHTHLFKYGPLVVVQHFDRAEGVNTLRFAGE